MANKFDVNRADSKADTFDMADDKDSTAQLFSSMLPFLLLIFLYSGCISVAPESIAGEKERGTIASLLITPVKRSHIALGKIAALSIIALLSGASSAIGTIASVPKLMSASTNKISGASYGVNDYIMLGIIILSTALVLVTLIALISAFAKTIVIGGGYDKESVYDEWIASFGTKVKSLVLLGQTADKIAEAAAKAGFTAVTKVDSLEEAVAECARQAQDGDAVLLSPACASWGMFKNFEERGDLFKEYVKKL